jgi:hypothetical protein
MGGKIDLSRKQEWNRVGHGHVPKMFIFKSGIVFVLGPSLPQPENQFIDGTSHKESTMWNQFYGIDARG